ncbi:sodium:pantothenate symporter [Raphidocelis subcapitata]|uniref:Sodium:pantothenate symporter n=1 Tax=Raphidocelis subcapitata TaxID=307507 RepID=A0A2V0NTM1_9CHLO|nr:sodium:pantothenate symporter [Raphidocelis subcapitata]|eukprot:GBF88910.1 sodium:pantothenate symporter [Raphidocelis subcapitata]
MLPLHVAYVVFGVYLATLVATTLLGIVHRVRASKHGDPVKEHYVAGLGLMQVAWFFSMSASLYSGYSVSGIVNESFNQGWTSTRWIPGGIGVYVGFLLLAPRFHTLGKTRGYMTLSHFIYERYLPSPSGGPVWVAHLLRLLSFAALQLPVFTYLITQFQALGIEVRTFTQGAISPVTAVVVSAVILLISDLLGGMRSVAYTDVVQGIVLFFGSIIFLIVQRTELGGLPNAAQYYKNPLTSTMPGIRNMQRVPQPATIVSYFDGEIAKGESAFSRMLIIVSNHGTGQAFLAALLLAAAVCAMMSTADSALLAFSVMWTVDLYKPYIRPSASAREQLFFGRVMSTLGLGVGVLLGLLTIQTGTPNLSALFSLQNVTPIHVAPAVWLGLHWRGLRGEAVAAGMVAGLAVTVGLVFSPLNVGLVKGLDSTACGLSTAMIGFFVNIFVTVALGLLLQYRPALFSTSDADSPARRAAAIERLDIGPRRDKMLNLPMLAAMFLLLLFSAPFCFKAGSRNAWVGDMAAWAFVALFFSGVLACATAAAYIWLWEDYKEPGATLPIEAIGDAKDAGGFGRGGGRGGGAAAAAAAAEPNPKIAALAAFREAVDAS